MKQEEGTVPPYQLGYERQETRVAATERTASLEDYPAEGSVWESGDSRRYVQENETHPAWQSVIYALYRRQKIWSDGKWQEDEWWLLRQVMCKVWNWKRWERHAKLIQSPNRKPST